MLPILLLLMNNPINTETIILGGGCFWCTEAVYSQINGITTVIPGYSGGATSNPSYEEVCSGLTNHAEVVEITYNPAIIELSRILDIFFATHDPTTLNRQGADVGKQYRSVIFYTSPEQKKVAEDKISELTKNKTFDNKIVTEISPSTKFYPAEKYHLNYFNNNQNKPYCRLVISPKIKKMKESFHNEIKR